MGGGSLVATAEERRLARVHSRLVPPRRNTNKGERSGQTDVEDDRVDRDVFPEERRLFFEDAEEPDELNTGERISQYHHDKLRKRGHRGPDDWNRRCQWLFR